MNRYRATNRLSLIAVSLLLLAGFAFVMSEPLAAQQPGDCYPDGCGSTTTTEPPTTSPTCAVSLEAGVAGVEVTATVSNVLPGEVVRLLLDGREVATGRSDGGGQSGDVVMTFDVPELAPGDYSIVAVGVGFTVTCGAGGLEVLGESAAAGSGGGANRGALAFTGVEIIGIIALALALVAAGSYLVRRSRLNRFA